MKGAILADWCDALEDWTAQQIKWALNTWRDQYPSKKPNPGHISGILKQERGRKFAERRQQPQPAPTSGPRITAERVKEILEEEGARMTESGHVLGFAPKKFPETGEAE